MTDLRKAAEMALEALHNIDQSNNDDAIEALRQALAQPVDAVNMSQERVDETAKREHEPYPEGDVVGPCICGSWPGGECLKCKRIEPPKREWVPTDEEYENFCSLIQREEAKLKEKNT